MPIKYTISLSPDDFFVVSRRLQLVNGDIEVLTPGEFPTKVNLLFASELDFIKFRNELEFEHKSIANRLRRVFN